MFTERGEKYEGKEFCVIGAGWTGTGTMASLKRAGIPFTAYEKSDNVGALRFCNCEVLLGPCYRKSIVDAL